MVVIALFVYTCLQSWCIQQLSVNYDEGLFAYYGVTILKLQGNKDVQKFDSKLPITALNVIPRAIEQVVYLKLSRSNSYTDIVRGRYISLFATILLALVVFRWSVLLYGRNAGFFSFFLVLICPNFLAHGIFVSSDIFACLFMTGSLYFLWHFGETGRNKYFLWSSIFVGFAEISKFSMIHLLVLIPAIVLVRFFSAGSSGRNGLTYWKLLRLLFYFIAINWIMINAAHLFYGMFIPLDEYEFKSVAFQQLQSWFQNTGRYLPIPFSSSYIKSLDAVMYFDHLGGGMPDSLNGPIYMLGSSSRNGFWYYYFVVLFYKMPVTVLLLLAASTFLYFKKIDTRKFISNEMYILVPVIYYLVYMDFFYSTQLGVRHILIIFPLLYIFAGFLFQQAGRWTQPYIYGLVAYQLVSVGLFFPHFLPYTNEFILDKKMVYKKMADTNLCYGEGEKYLRRYMRQHPEAIYLPDRIIEGRIIMEVNEMLNLNIVTMGKYNWVRSLTPTDHIDSQYLIFDVSKKQADSLKALHF